MKRSWKLLVVHALLVIFTIYFDSYVIYRGNKLEVIDWFWYPTWLVLAFANVALFFWILFTWHPDFE